MLAPRSPLRFIVPTVVLCFVVASLFNSGILSRGPAKDIDSRYFYVAAKMWVEGQSPYETAHYGQVFAAQFGEQPNNGYPYLPTSVFFVLPMAWLDWPTAALVFSWVNFLAALTLFGLCWALLRQSLGASLGPLPWLWLGLGTTLGGIGGTLFTGQSSVLIATAVVAAVAGFRWNKPWLAVLGLVLATAKPQLSFPLLLFLALFQPRSWKVLVVAGALAVGTTIAAALVDPDLLHNFLGSLNSYRSADQNNAATGFGFSGFLGRLGMPSPWSSLVGVLVALAVLGRAWALLVRSKVAPSEHPGVLVLLSLAVGLVLPIHEYDASVYALAVVFVATTRPGLQAALLVPALFLWRPNLLPDLLARLFPGPLPAPGSINLGDVFLMGSWLILLVVSFVFAEAFRPVSNPRVDSPKPARAIV